MITRRELHLLLLQAAQTGPVPAQESALPDLPLSPADARDLADSAQRVLREARWLQELPLDGVPPAFIFTPR